MTWIAWLNVIGFQVVLGSVIAAATSWAVRRSLSVRLVAIERALTALTQQDQPQSDGAVPRSGSVEDLLQQDPHARYRRPTAL